MKPYLNRLLFLVLFSPLVLFGGKSVDSLQELCVEKCKKIIAYSRPTRESFKTALLTTHVGFQEEVAKKILAPFFKKKYHSELAKERRNTTIYSFIKKKFMPFFKGFPISVFKIVAYHLLFDHTFFNTSLEFSFLISLLQRSANCYELEFLYSYSLRSNQANDPDSYILNPYCCALASKNYPMSDYFLTIAIPHDIWVVYKSYATSDSKIISQMYELSEMLELITMLDPETKDDLEHKAYLTQKFGITMFDLESFGSL